MAAEPRLVAWSGTTLGIGAIHVWRPQPVDGRTRASTDESYEGLVARVLRRPSDATTRGSLR